MGYQYEMGIKVLIIVQFFSSFIVRLKDSFKRFVNEGHNIGLLLLQVLVLTLQCNLPYPHFNKFLTVSILLSSIFIALHAIGLK